MKLVLYRSYLPESTTGTLFAQQADQETFICFTLELPWRGNAKNISCIPEGVYNASCEKHTKHGYVYRLKDVENRTGILIHPANSVSELRGCIACVQMLTTDIYGIGSKAMVKKMIDVLEGEPCVITIKTNHYDR